MRWLVLSALVIVFDQVTKQVAGSALALHEPVAIMPMLNFTLTRNAGAAFSLLQDAGGWQRWFFSALSIIVSTFIIVWLRRLGPTERWVPCALALVLGGALGNLWDRLALGEVVDFIDVYVGHWHWPAFNVADSAISVGAVMLLAGAFRTR